MNERRSTITAAKVARLLGDRALLTQCYATENQRARDGHTACDRFIKQQPSPHDAEQWDEVSDCGSAWCADSIDQSVVENVRDAGAQDSECNCAQPGLGWNRRRGPGCNCERREQQTRADQ